MFRLSLLLFLAMSLIACSSSPSETETEVATIAPAASSQSAPAPPTTSNRSQTGTLLCQVNGQPWHYTKASGVITKDRKTEKRTALLTFTKKLEKGSESIQLYYDYDTHEIEKAALQFKRPKAEGGLFTCFYTLALDTRKKLPGNSLAGTIDLSDPKTATGNASILNVGIQWEKDKLADPEDAVVSLTDLQFSGIGYSDLAVEKKKLGI